MNKTKQQIIGLFFILPLVFYGLGSVLLDPIFQEENTSIFFSSNIKIGALLIIANSIIVFAISSLLFPLVKAFSKQVAYGYLFARGVESLLLLVGLIGLLAFASVGEENSNEMIRQFASSINYFSFEISMLILGIGSIPVFYIFFRERILPSFLAIWGCIGYALLLAGSFAELLGFPYGVELSIPGGLFELSFGIWMLVNGLNVSQTKFK